MSEWKVEQLNRMKETYNSKGTYILRYAHFSGWGWIWNCCYCFINIWRIWNQYVYMVVIINIHVCSLYYYFCGNRIVGGEQRTEIAKIKNELTLAFNACIITLWHSFISLKQLTAYSSPFPQYTNSLLPFFLLCIFKFTVILRTMRNNNN